MIMTREALTGTSLLLSY